MAPARFEPASRPTGDLLPNGHGPPLKPQKSSATVAGIINRLASKARPTPTGQLNNGEVPPSPPSTVSSSSDSSLREVFRDAASSVWVITSAWDNHPVGFTAITINTVSIDPPMISFNVGRSSSSLNTLSRSLRFAAHLLGHADGHVAQRFATTTEQRFKDLSTWKWNEDGLPELLPGALARLSGSIVSLSAAGENLIALATVDDIARNAGQPLIYQQGLYRALDLGATKPPPARRIYLNAFDMSCVGHMSPGLFSHPDDKSSTYKDLEYWTDLARILERGGFDSIFIADVLGIYDVYQGSRNAALRAAAQVPVNDPVGPISAMAAVTKRLGFGVTVSLSYELPYSFARRMSTLDHLTKGRVAWNIVTGYLKSAAINMGLDDQVPHDERYNIAEEFLEVCYKLWEGSWEDDAVIKDVRKGVYTDPSKVHDIGHDGKYFTVPGAHLCEPSPQRTPYLFQAGASSRGQAFAAKHAESVFIAGPSIAHVRKLVEGFRSEAEKQGRNPRDIKIFALLTIITGPTDAAAHAKFADYKRYVSIEGALALYGGWAGVDLSAVDPDQPLEYVENDAIRSVNQMWSKQGTGGEVWTARKIGEKIALGGLGPVLVGNGPSIADLLEQWQDETDVDGFNLAYAVTPGTFEDIVEYVVPELRSRGRLPPGEPDDAARKTLRERMGGPNATAHVSPDHPAYEYKVGR